MRRLTVKLRGRTETPALGAEGAQFLSARGAKPQAHHGPLQRLLDGDALAIACLHSSRNAAQVPAPTSAQTIHDGTLRMPASESSNPVPAISKSGAVIPQ
jgi:hypothetical protein